MKKIFSTAALLFVFASLVAAQEKKLEPLVVSYASVSGSRAPLWIAKEMGLFEKYGLDGNPIFVPAGYPSISALISGDVQFIATGGSLEHCIRLLADRGCTDITVLCVLAAPEGLARLERSGLPLRIVTAAVDERLNERMFIVPGLGDAGDRQFGGMPRF